MARGVVRMARWRGVGVPTIERREGVDGCADDVPREMAGQPSVEGDGNNAEPHTEPMSPEPPHE